MVDADAVDRSFGIEAKQLGVDRLENFVVLDPQRHEFVDVEEAPPVDLVVRCSPPRQSIVLALEKVMQLSRPPKSWCEIGKRAGQYRCIGCERKHVSK